MQVLLLSQVDRLESILFGVAFWIGTIQLMKHDKLKEFQLRFSALGIQLILPIRNPNDVYRIRQLL